MTDIRSEAGSSMTKTPRVFLLLGLYAVGLAVFAFLAVGVGFIVAELAR